MQSLYFVCNLSNSLNIDYSKLSRSLSRIGNAYTKLDDLHNAIIYFNKSLSEHRDKELQKKVQAVSEIDITYTLLYTNNVYILDHQNIKRKGEVTIS